MPATLLWSFVQCIAHLGAAHTVGPHKHQQLIRGIKEEKLQFAYDHLIIAGDMNLSDTDWHTLSSTDDTELCILGGFVDLGVQQIVPLEQNGQSLDVILTDQLMPKLDCVVDYSFGKFYNTNGRYLSDHEPFCLTVEFHLPKNQNQRIVLHLPYASLDWKLLQQEIKDNLFYLFCNSNVNFLLIHWYVVVVVVVVGLLCS